MKKRIAVAMATMLATLAFSSMAASADTATATSVPDMPRTDTPGAAALAGVLRVKYPTTKVDEVAETPMRGIYQVVTGKNIFYTNDTADQVILGMMIDMASKRNLTEEKQEALNKVGFGTLNLDNAIVEVKGTGARKLVMFTDVHCGYCKQFEATLKKDVTDVTIYRFLYPILSSSSVQMSKAIWCVGDNDRRRTAMENYMERGMAPSSDGNCTNPIDENLALGRDHNLSGTPSLVNGAGQVRRGAIARESLEAFLNAGADGQTVVVDTPAK
jgi:thiol:disulfide interchange protein DsbC